MKVDASLAPPLDEAAPRRSLEVEQPRERLTLYGAAALGEEELIALVLGGGRGRVRARGLLEAFSGLSGLARALPEELEGCLGIGRAGACAVVAAFELGRRSEATRLPWTRSLRSPDEVAAFVRSRVRGLAQEHFLVIGLDARQRVRQLRTAGVGSLSQVDVHPREVFRPLVRAGLHSCVLVHNHPSGDSSPSASDLELTRRMAEVGRLVGIPVLDHVIVSDADSTSLAALGMLD